MNCMATEISHLKELYMEYVETPMILESRRAAVLRYCKFRNELSEKYGIKPYHLELMCGIQKSKPEIRDKAKKQMEADSDN